MAMRYGSKRISVTGVKRRQANDDAVQLQLERVFGVTLSSNCGLCFDSTNSVLAYPAGCTIVLCNVVRREQHFIVNPSKKTITCLDMSSDGKFLASGEFGYNPAVRIWELSTRTQLAEFAGHKFAIACVRFCRAGDQRFVVSVGNQYDQSVSVWNWRTHKQAACNRNTAKIYAVAFAPNDNFFVTVGVRHVRFWSIQIGSASQSQATVPLNGRNAILGDVQNNVFIDVACGSVGDSRAPPATFALTQSGTVCQFDERRALTRCIDARADLTRPTCLSLLNDILFVGAFDGQVAGYSALTLQLVGHMPKPHNVLDDGSTAEPRCVKYPDVVALAADTRNGFLATVYNDHSLYVWNVACDADEKENDIDSATSKLTCASVEVSYRAHSKCVWHIDTYPIPLDGVSMFVTCGNDCTLRFWRVANDSTSLIRTAAVEADFGALLDSNIAAYTNQFDQQTSAGPATSGINGDYGASPRGVNGANQARNPGNRSITPANIPVPVAPAKANDSGTAKCGLKVARFKPDGQELAVGDRVGNVRIFRVSVTEAITDVRLEASQLLAAHDNEVTALEFLVAADCCLLASASRDRMIHIFDAARGYEHLQTLDEHSSVVNAVRFVILPQQQTDAVADKSAANVSGSNIGAANVRCVSCSADHSLLFRSMLTDESGRCRFVLAQNTAVKTALYDIDTERQQLTVVGQDRFVRSYCVDTCKPTRQFRIAVNEHPSVLGVNSSGSMGANLSVNVNPGASALTAFPIRIASAPSGAYTALSLTNKDVQLYDAAASSLISAANGHGELVLGLRFSHDSRRLVTVAGDGCVFVWRVATPAERRAQASLARSVASPARRVASDLSGNLSSGRSPLASSFGASPCRPVNSSPFSQLINSGISADCSKASFDNVDVDEVPCRDVPSIRASVPMTELDGSEVTNSSGLLNGSGNARARVTGAWAQRAVGEPLVIKSRLDQSGAVTLTVDQLLAFDNDSSRRRISMDSSVCTVDLANHSMNSSTNSVLPSCAEEPQTVERTGVISALIDSAIREERETNEPQEGYRTAPVSEGGRRAEPHSLSLPLRNVIDDAQPQKAEAGQNESIPVGADDREEKMTASTPISEVLTIPDSDDHDLFGTPRRLNAETHSTIREEPIDEASMRSQIENWLNDVNAAGTNPHQTQTPVPPITSQSAAENEVKSTDTAGEAKFETPKRETAVADGAVADGDGVAADKVDRFTTPSTGEFRAGCARETCTQRFLQMTRSRNHRHLRFSLQNEPKKTSTCDGLANESDPLDYNRNRIDDDDENRENGCDCDDLFTIVTGLGHLRAHRSATSPTRPAKANYANRLATSKSMFQTAIRSPSFIQFTNRLTRSKSESGERRVRSVSDVDSSALSSTSSFSTERKSRSTAFRIIGSPMRNSSRNSATIQKTAASTALGVTPIASINSLPRRLTSTTRNSLTRQRQLGLIPSTRLGAKSVVGGTTGLTIPSAIACPLRDQLGQMHALQTHVEQGLTLLLGHELLLKTTPQTSAIAAAIQLVGLTEQNATAAVQHCKLLRAELEQRLPKPPPLEGAQLQSPPQPHVDSTSAQPATDATTATSDEPQPAPAAGELNALAAPNSSA